MRRDRKQQPKKKIQLMSLQSSFLRSRLLPFLTKSWSAKKSGKAAAVLSRSLKELHQEFISSGQQISFSKFAKCRPANIRLMAQAKLRQCLCVYCTNTKLKLETINSVAAAHNKDCWIRHERHAVALTTCDPKKKACCYGECTDCGLHLFDAHISPLLDHAGKLTWRCWESRNVLSKGKRISRQVLATKRGNIQKLVGELCKELKFLAQHLFRADWQLQKFAEMKKAKPFPSGSVCMVMDFAENFSCTYQEEIQAAHWHYDQVTVHPTVTYYRCPVCSDTTTESLVFISPDKKHDHHAVQAFTTKALTHLRETRRLDISHIVQWTDGCACQYKSKGPFADISLSLANFNASLERNFFGSRHGKSPSDGESAVVKHHATSAVVSKRAIIANALDMYEYLQSSSLNKQPPAEGCSHFLRSFFWVAEEDIQRHCPQKQAKTVPGTRSFHSVRSTELNTIQSRHLTCVCTSCQNGVGDCSEEQVVGPWTIHNLQQQSRHQKDTKLSLPLLQQVKDFPNPSSSVQLDPQSMEDKAPLTPPSPFDPPSPQPTPSVITLPAIHTVGDVINVQVIHHNDHALLPLEVDLIPSSSVETSPAASPLVSPSSSADPGTSGVQPTVAPSFWSPHELPSCSAQPTSLFKGLTDIKRVFKEKEYSMTMEHRAVIYQFKWRSTPEELARLCGQGPDGWLCSSHIVWILDRINEAQDTSLALCISASSPDELARRMRHRDTSNIERLVLVANVGKKSDNSVFLATPQQSGSHWVLITIELFDEPVISYCDSNGWNCPPNLLFVLSEYTQHFGICQLTNVQVRIMHTPTPLGYNHACTSRCMAYPVQSCSNVCGLVVVVGSVIAALDRRLFKLLTETEPSGLMREAHKATLTYSLMGMVKESEAPPALELEEHDVQIHARWRITLAQNTVAKRYNIPSLSVPPPRLRIGIQPSCDQNKLPQELPQTTAKQCKNEFSRKENSWRMRRQMIIQTTPWLGRPQS